MVKTQWSVLVAASLVLLPFVDVAAQDACGDKKLKFKVDDRGCVTEVLNENDGSPANEVEVCVSDTVTWKVKVDNHAKGDKDKSVKFKASSPFDWVDSGFKGSGNKIEGKVRADAVQGDAPTRYSYSVKARLDDQECELDPVIIVRR